jgi:predicted Na+-dependent transporter
MNNELMTPQWKLAGLAVNRFYERNMIFFIPASLVLGFLFYRWFDSWSVAIPYLFAYITFVMALDCNVRQLVQTLKFPIPILLTLLLVHGAAPYLAYQLGGLVFGEGSPYIIGLVLFAVIPLGVSSVIWVRMIGGNIPLTLSLIVIDSLFSPLVVPFLIHLYFGESIEFDSMKVMLDLMKIVVIPTILGVVVNELTRGRALKWSGFVAGPTSKLAFFMVVLINAAVIAPLVHTFKSDMLLLVTTSVTIILVGYALGWLGARWFRDPAILRTMTYSAGIKNISLGIVIGITYFEPKAVVPIVLTILIQQPMATLMFQVFKKWGRSQSPS